MKTPGEIRDIINRALREHAKDRRMQASGRRMSGPQNAGGRTILRRECDEIMLLAELASQCDPMALQIALTRKASTRLSAERAMADLLTVYEQWHEKLDAADEAAISRIRDTLWNLIDEDEKN
jgi:hypothetical protein